MQRMRWCLSWLAAGWVLCQLAAFAAAPIVLSADGLDPVTVERCTCAEGAPGAACPMHQGHGGDPKRSGTDCKLRSSCASSEAALLSLAGGLGLVPSPAVVSVNRVVALIPGPLVRALNRVELPEFPPPRC
jgi:hypothetical protein